MSDAAKEQLLVDPLPGYDPEVGRALWAIEDSRRRTRKILDGIAPSAVDWDPGGGENTIGTLLYHIAAIEADWFYVEVLEQEDFPPDVVALFPHDVRDEQGRLTVAGVGLDDHLARLAAVRAQLLAGFRGMTPAEFHRPRDLPSYAVSPAWVVQHLMQHEAEHRGQIDVLRMRAESTLASVAQ